MRFWGFFWDFWDFLGFMGFLRFVGDFWDFFGIFLEIFYWIFEVFFGIFLRFFPKVRKIFLSDLPLVIFHVFCKIERVIFAIRYINKKSKNSASFFRTYTQQAQCLQKQLGSL